MTQSNLVLNPIEVKTLCSRATRLAFPKFPLFLSPSPSSFLLSLPYALNLSFYAHSPRFNADKVSGFDNDAVAFFNCMVDMCPPPSTVEINKTVSLNSNPSSISNLEIAQKIAQTLINSASGSNNFRPTMELQSLLSLINPHIVHLVLSNPRVPPHSCLAFCNLLKKNHSLTAHKPDLQAHVCRISKLYHARQFAAVKNIFNFIVTDGELCCPALSIIALFDKREPQLIAKLCDMLFRVYADNRLFEEAFIVYDYLEENELVMEERSCFVVLLALKKCDEVDLLLRFFRRMVESGRVEIRVQSLTLVIDVLCRRREVKIARALMEEMVGKGIVKPNVFTYNTLLNAYIGTKNEKGVNQILKLMEKWQVIHNLVTFTLLIQWYASSGNIEEAEKIFEDIRKRELEPDVYVYTSLISWNCKVRNLKRAFALFDELTERGIVPNAHTYGALISGVCKAGQMEAAEILVKEMHSKGNDINIVIFNTMIDGYCKRGMIDKALRLQVIMESKGFEADVFTHNSIASGLCKLNRYEEAKRFLIAMVEKGVAPNVVSCTTFIEIYCKEGNLAEAERFFRDMGKKGGVPNVVTYNTIIDGYSKKGKMEQAHRLKFEMIDKGLLPDVYTYTSLIHGECVAGRVDEAVKLFDEMSLRGITGNVVTYTAIISGLSKEGRVEESFKIYDEMMGMGLTPDYRVYTSLVGSLHKPCSHDAIQQK